MVQYLDEAESSEQVVAKRPPVFPRAFVSSRNFLLPKVVE